MDRIAVVTDSASNLPAQLLAGYGITVVPLYLHWEGRAYRDGVDITPDEVYRGLREGSALPQTAAPSVGDFLRAYLELSEEARAIVSIHLPAKLSGTIGSARLAGDLAASQVQVCVVDAGTAAMGAGLVALGAARLASQGADLEAVVEAAYELRSQVSVYVLLDTLYYLYRSGRIGGAASLVGTALQIKPVICLKNGVVDVLSRPRTRPKALCVILDEMAQEVNGHAVRVAVMHADAAAEANQMRGLIQARFQCVEVLTTAFTPVMGAHTGPGVVGVAFYPEE